MTMTPEEAVRLGQPTYFVAPFDPTGRLLTAHRSARNLSLAEAKALQDEATRQGGLLLIYAEQPRSDHEPAED